MRFLLLAPGRDHTGVGDASVAEPAVGTLTSQFDHRTQFLIHSYPRMKPDAVERAGAVACVPFSAREVRIDRALGYAVLVADVEVDFPAGASREEREAALTDVATALARNSGVSEIEELRWVGRYRILCAGDAAESGWGSANSSRVPLREDTAYLETGWANGTLRGWELLSAVERWDIIRGLVDAQVLWCQLEDVQQSSRVELRELYLTPARARLTRKAAALTDINARLQVHKLCVADLISGTQGRRREVALATLDGWEFADLSEHTATDITSAMAHIEALHRIRSQRYQRAVEAVLLALTLVSALGLVLDFIAVAYINVTNQIPDSGGEGVPILRLFRDVDSDLLLSGSLAVLALVVGMLVISRYVVFPRGRQ